MAITKCTIALRTDWTRSIEKWTEPSNIDTVQFYTVREILSEEADVLVEMGKDQVNNILKTYIK